MVIFGGGGDLAKRKLFPALHNLRKSGLLHEQFAVVSVAHNDIKIGEFRKQIAKDLETRLPHGILDHRVRDWLIERLHCVAGELTGTSVYGKLRDTLTQGNAIFYLATPPSLFSVIPAKLAEAGLLKQTREGERRQWRRIVIEKPFGRDWESARGLNQELRRVADEDQIYRIDHYLGKETVQNIMALRFANGIFEPIWNRRYVDSVQITVAESIGVEERGDYYDHSGALRDMVPNHLLQLVALIGMEAPNSFDADEIRDEKVKLLKGIKVLAPEDVLTHAVRGQYDSGTADGKVGPAYSRESNVRADSLTETFVAMKLEIDSWRWAGVPFYVRTGKRMAGRLSEVIIQFRRAPIQMFRQGETALMKPNLLVMQIQPQERIQMRFSAKVPGPLVRLGDVMMNFDYMDTFGSAPQTGYETLLFDCMKGDATLFQRADQIETGWKIVQPILDIWQSLKPRNFPNYPAGSWGPKAADDLLARDGREWLTINCCDPPRAAVEAKPETNADKEQGAA
jgi:glucose-6-phosphate 1-dehydrogenase